MASTSQTTYKPKSKRETIRITADWHPHRGVELEVMRWEIAAKPHHVVVRLPDGTGKKVPLAWTDAVPETPPIGLKSRYSVESLRELMTLVAALIGGHE